MILRNIKQTAKRYNMKAVKVTYTNGDKISTNINGTDEEIKAYFAIGKTFNIGSVEDNLQQVTELEFLTD